MRGFGKFFYRQAPDPFLYYRKLSKKIIFSGGVRPEDLAAGISRLSVIEEGDVQQQQQQHIAINISGKSDIPKK